MIYWIWLTQIKGIGAKTQRILLDRFNNPKNIYKATTEELIDCIGIGETTANNIINSKSLDKARKILDDVTRLNIKILTLDNPIYPDKVKYLKEAPVLLYYKGSIKKDSLGVAIVGARRCSNYGKQVAKEVGEFLASNNIPVISGMAKGIDGYAHTACLKAGGYTIAILGNGLGICYPKEHIELMEKIIEKGAVISEYPPCAKPDPKYFPKRNYLISAWAYKVLIIEAGLKSGTLITAKNAIKQDRELFAVPDNIYKIESMGCNRIIGEGAKIYIDKNQLLLENNKISKSIDNNKKERKIDELAEDNDEKKLLSILYKEGPKTIDDLSNILNIYKSKLLEKISIMELEDKVIIEGNLVKTN